MRVGLITTSYPRWRGDAAGSFVAGHAAYLRRTGATVEIVATGSEVSVAVGAAELLRAEDVPTRVVPVLDRGEYSPTDGVTTVSVEAGATSGWHGVVDLALGIDTFGDSGKGDEVMAHHGFTAEKVADRIREFLADEGSPTP